MIRLAKRKKGGTWTLRWWGIKFVLMGEKTDTPFETVSPRYMSRLLRKIPSNLCSYLIESTRESLELKDQELGGTRPHIGMQGLSEGKDGSNQILCMYRQMADEGIFEGEHLTTYLLWVY